MKPSETMFTRRALLIALLAILVAGAVPILAQGPNIPDDEPDRAAMAPNDATDFDGDFGPGRGQGLARLARHLELTEAQRASIAKIHEAGRARDLPLRKQIMQLRHDLRGEMMKDDPSEKTATGLTQRIGDLRTQMQTARIQDRLAVRALLTPEQRDRMLMLGERGRRWGFRHGGFRDDARHGGPHGWQRGHGADQD